MPSALREQLFRGGLFLATALAAIAGIALPYALKYFLPAGVAFPYTAIAASMVLNFGALAALLMFLSQDKRDDSWSHFAAWLGALLVSAAAFGGLALARTHSESAHTFIALWLLFAAEAASVTAICALLRVWTCAQRLSLQITLLLIGAAVTAVFWSREPITLLAREGQRHESVSADRLASGVLKLSPPFAVASAWNQECDAASNSRRGNRFDLIRAPLTYDVWIGSYQAMPYPEILPSRESADPDEYGARALKPGVVLALLLWGVPLLIFADVLQFASRKPRTA